MKEPCHLPRYLAQTLLQLGKVEIFREMKRQRSESYPMNVNLDDDIPEEHIQLPEEDGVRYALIICWCRSSPWGGRFNILGAQQRYMLGLLVGLKDSRAKDFRPSAALE